ncbi:hypothetical protein K8I61_10505 [bacterium]|nr:hypothetical protein [bacterium]
MIPDTLFAALLVAGAAVLVRLAPKSARVPMVAAISLAVFFVRDPVFAAIASVLVASVYVCVRAMGKSRRRAPLVMGAAVTLGVLVIGKYVAPSLLSAGDAHPLGISYLAFTLLLALAEVTRRQTAPPSATLFAAHTFFFPTLIAGPIKSLARFADETDRDGEAASDFAKGAKRIAIGLVKTNILAATLAPMTAGFDRVPDATAFELWIALYAYAFFLYFNFAGYSDIAIGAARLLGWRIEENFEAPYVASNIRDFWRRWHISLTHVMRECVYIPLGGNRVPFAREYFNVLVVFLLIGIWHGGEAHFVAWGAYHGLGMIAHRVLTRRKPAAAPVSLARRAVSMIVTFHFVAWGWVLFACPLDDALVAWTKMLGLG